MADAAAARGALPPDEFDEGMLADHIGFRVHIARRAIQRAMREFDDGAQLKALPSGSISILELVARNPGLAPQDLAQVLFLDRPKVTLLIRHLSDAGLIDRRVSPEDGRKAELRVTEAGMARLEASRTLSALQEQKIAQGLSAAERAQLARLLRKLQETLR
ncbi:MarR family transcriptional regulator [Altererythrobacter salegens]|uniref:MarR family transcriptional regulator n=1 Tax=Croceibacterium salegens TaxID=1737568 RepID=A0A6I4SU20_9SPHN|nr:MarR family transcriptional regulator [Croceibacterium salegens]MXO58440.1 MarR family transcriptional regulator [Croceibacterium salegens]